MTAEHRREYAPRSILSEGFFSAFDQFSEAVQEEVIAQLHTAPDYVGPQRQVSRGELPVEEINYKRELADSFAAALDPNFPVTRNKDTATLRSTFLGMINPISPTDIPFAATEIFHHRNEQQRKAPKNR